MAESSFPFRGLAALLVIAAAGASAWYFLSDERKDELEAAVRQTVEENVVRPLKDSLAEPKAPSPEAPKEAGASLRSGDDARPESREDALIREVESAIAGTDSSGSPEAAEGAPEASGALSSAEMPADDAAEDPVMGFGFVKDFAGFLAASYVPGRNGAPGRSSVSMVKANARYSSSPRLRSVESDPFRAREAIIRHICRPGVLEAVYRMYAPRLLAEMESAARQGKVGDTDAGIAAMFEAYAAFSEKAANTLEASGQVDLKTIVGIIREAAGRESAANEDFSRAYNAHGEAMEAGNKAEAAVQGRRMAESSRLAAMHASTQEKAKGDIAWAMRRRAGKAPVMGEADLIFLGEWLVRHDIGPESSSAAAGLLRKFAGLCSEKAALLKGEDISLPAHVQPSGIAAGAQSGNSPAHLSGKPSPVPESAPSEKAASAAPSEAAPVPSVVPQSSSDAPSGQEVVAPMERAAPAASESGALQGAPSPEGETEKTLTETVSAQDGGPSDGAPSPHEPERKPALDAPEAMPAEEALQRMAAEAAEVGGTLSKDGPAPAEKTPADSRSSSSD